MHYDLDIILPCYNPHEGWTDELLTQFFKLQTALNGVRIHLIIVNDGSSHLIDEYNFIKIKNAHFSTTIVEYTENKGKGYAVRAGLKESKASFQLYTDIDFPFKKEAMIAAYDALQNGVDVVIGNRKSSYETQLRPYRKMLSIGSHLFNKYLLGLPYIDTQGGMKAFSEAGRREMLATKINRYLFDTEFVMRCVKQKNIKIQEVPIETREGIFLSEMGFSVLRKEFGNILRLLRVRLSKAS
jgi:glycosyltransferase involved in cell wall biosynthesis